MKRNASESPLYRFGVFELDPAAGELRRRGLRVRVQNLPLRILRTLLDRTGEAVSRQELRRALWPKDVLVGFDHSLNAGVNKLRRALGDTGSNPRFVETLHGLGYRFLGPVESIPRPPRAARPGSRHPAAKASYEIGRHHWNRRTPASLLESLRHFREASDLDPLFGPAFAGMAQSYAMLAEYGAITPEEGFACAHAAAEKALELDPGNPEARSALGLVHHRHRWDFPSAQREYRLALAADPRNATARQWYAEYLSQRLRHGEAVAQIREARRLDPLSPAVSTVEAWIRYHSGNLTGAETRCRRALELRPGFPLGQVVLGRILAARGRFAEGDRAIRDALAQDPDNPFFLCEQGVVGAMGGAKECGEAALRRLSDLAQARPVSPFFMAKLHAWLGRMAAARRELRAGFRVRSNWMLDLAVDPELSPLHGDPTYVELVRRMKL